ncbi:DUF349 domain-containing protein [Flavobacterium azooxidireducens]|uniref:DUF349 domain-containing protein n=1 Tax=Flavobacterium azooxidireducens TaxID=1871076 RepID=A0ABY4KD83_9FLAO|nr:DUF349 domain-containing protein [Flavobacterium azooxidireducens]UPQ78255.1 DUF349 domain-containing protein [Flavobacterium azooxidireducens]
MLEEKNDNLSPIENETDGNQENVLKNEVEETVDAVSDEVETENTAPIEEEAVVEISAEELADDSPETESEHQKALNAIDDTNAEESEDETLKDRHDIPLLDYHSMSMEALVDELEKLSTVEKVMSIKEHVEEIKKEFLSKYTHFIDEKRDEFIAENPDTTEEFEYHLPLKPKFDSLYKLIKGKQNAHFKSLQNNLQANLNRRLAIVEEIKNLINPQENIKDTLKHFNELREEWRNIGPIPRDKYNHVWNNYHFHVENFYDYLHLDREARDLDFKHNLELKQKIIARVEELVNEEDVTKAFRELQDLHRIWKEEIGPVDREHREEIWNQFSALTKQMHDKREGLFANQREKEVANLERKKAIIAEIEELAKVEVTAHSQWQGYIEKVEALRNSFFSAGRVPSEINEETWAEFKTAVRNFNSHKNSFYKDIKKEQSDNLNKKLALVEKAKAMSASEDFAATTPLMKQIQEEWKQIGHVPRKYSDKVWKDFKDACNQYFDRMKATRNDANSEEIEAFDKKKAYLDSMKDFELVGDHKTDLDAIKAHIEQWKSFGKVPFSRRHIEGKFNKILDALFEKLSLSKKDSDMMRFSNKLEQLAGSDDSRKLEGEKIFIIRKIEEVQSEIFQLENNIQFFTHAKKDNPLVKEVFKNIEKHKDELKTWKDKLKQLRNLSQE